MSLCNSQENGVEVTSKAKKQALGQLLDCHSTAYAANGVQRPATIICPFLDDVMRSQKVEAAADSETGKANDREEESGPNIEPTDALLESLRGAFGKLTGGKDKMDSEAMEAWLIAINGQLGRGSEFRKATALLDARGGDGLLFEDFLAVYLNELAEGKYWGVNYDMKQALGFPVKGAGEGEAFRAVFDYVFHSEGVQPVAIREELTREELAKALSGEDPLPNAWQPSDHVMQTSTFTFL